MYGLKLMARKLGILVLAFSVPLGLVVLVQHALAATAPPTMSAGQSANLTRPCSHAGITSQTVSVSGTTARATNAVTAGSVVQVTCRLKAWLNFGASNNTAVATGADVYVTNDVPYWFYVESGSNYLAFIKVSGETDAACLVSECR